MKLDELLQMADSCLILSQRLGEWAGKGPAIEEDMASMNTALDLLGHARMWYEVAGKLDPDQRSEDDFAYWREASAFNNLLIVELPNAMRGSAANETRDYAVTVMREFLFDAWHYLRLEQLRASSEDAIKAIADKAFKEVSYHVRRSSDLVVRLGDGTDESHSRMQAALNWLWPYTGEMFAGDLNVLHAAWLKFVKETLDEATLVMPSSDVWMQKGVLQGGSHTEHLGYVLAEMQSLARAHAGVSW